MSDPITGVLNLAKPAGVTSHDVVARVRRLAGQRSVGHAGTLDPLATGVLVVLLGKATVLAQYVMAGRKVYEANVRFGAATTTDDAEGKVVREAPVPSAGRDEIEAVLARFEGTIAQRPPQYSAIKKEGRRAYAEARQGREVELSPRPVRINQILVLEWAPPILRLSVTCGPGVYIRALARDIGPALGSAAYLSGLSRVASGHFRLEDAVPLDHLTAENIGRHVLPADNAVASLRKFVLSQPDSERARHGSSITVDLQPATDQEIIRLYSASGAFLGLARHGSRGWRPFRVLDAAQ